MSQNYTWPSVSVSATNPSVGVNGTTAPTSSTEVAGINPSGNITPLSTDASGNLKVVVEAGTSTTQNVNLADVGGSAIAIGQAAMAASLPVVIASNQSNVSVAQATAASLNATVVGTGTFAVQAAQSGTWNINNVTGTVSLPTGAATNAELVTINSTLGSPFQAGGAISNTSFIATQATGTNLHTVVDSSALPTGAATNAELITINTTLGSPFQAGGSIGNTSFAVTQATASSLNATVVQATAASLNATVVGTVNAKAATPTALTVTQAAITVGTTAVRLTVSGSAPASTRVVLVATPDKASTATFYIGSSSVTNSGSTRGIEIAAGQSFIANNDAGDYWIVSSVASQTVTVMEQA